MGKGYIKFWGVRGSHPTPDLNKINYGGDTACVEIRISDHMIILDMGSGIRNLGEMMLNDKKTPKNVHIFLSHFHWDHIIGFASFKPVYIEGFNLNIYAKKPEVGS